MSALIQNNDIQVAYNATPAMKKSAFSLRRELSTVCGPVVFGQECPESVKRAQTKLVENCKMAVGCEYYTHIPTGKVVAGTPSEEDCVARMVEELKGCAKFYDDRNGYYDYVDEWAAALRKKDCEPLFRNNGRSLYGRRTPNRKRFTSKKLDRDEYLERRSVDRGFLGEGFVVGFLNQGLKCPECKKIGTIGLCGGTSIDYITSFRDAICMHCHEQGKITLFEIKTRWEKHIAEGGKTTYAGNFVAMNTLMAMGASVYMVLVSRDTGKIRIGKVGNAKPRANKAWLFSLQENKPWANPSCFTICETLSELPVCMTPLVETISDNFRERVAEKAMEIYQNSEKEE